MKTAALSLLGALLIAPFAAGQKLDLKLDAIAAKASSKNEVTLDGPLLQLALSQLQAKSKDAKDGKDGKSAKALPAILSGVQGVYIRNYEFDKPGLFADSDLDPIRSQVGDGSGWSRIVSVKEKKESTEIFLQIHGDEVAGALILNAEAKELNVIHIAGSFKLADMKELVDSNVKYDLSALMAGAAH